MRILFTGGGSGGHVFPIIAIKEAFLEPHNFYYLGPDSFAKENFENQQIKTKFIFAGKIKRYFSLGLPIEIIKTIFGFIQSLWYLFFWMPDVIFSKGGYGSFPVILAGWIYRIPIVLHDSDSIPGLANKILAKFAKKIILSFPNSAKYFKKSAQGRSASGGKIIVIGNPIRKELLEGDKNKAREIFKISTLSTSLGASKPVILITGGSQGAEKINEIVINTLPRLLEISEIIHSCGERNFKNTEKDAQKSPNYHLYPFLKAEELKHAYALSDLIISRAGAGNIFEIAALGKPSILIPLPNSAQEHQRQNAYDFKGDGRCIVLEQENLTPNLFLEQISNLLSDSALMQAMSEKAKTFYNPQTNELIRDEILKFAQRA